MPVKIGKIYGRLEVLYKCDYFYHPPSKPKSRQSMYHVRCICDAHKEFDVLGQSLTSGNTKSCDAYKKKIKLLLRVVKRHVSKEKIINENKILYWAVIPLPDELINNTKKSLSAPLFDETDICANCSLRYICEEQEEFNCK